MIEAWLVPIAFFTSCLAGAIGMGGGVLLIAAMPGLLPAGAILPIHAVTQLASNASRAVFGWRHIDFSMLPALTVGAVAGAWLGGEVYQSLNLHWLPAIIGGLLLLFTWAPLPSVVGKGHVALVLLGFYQTGVGMLVGATGPVGAAVLLRRGTARDWLVVNTATYMALNHLLRVLAFTSIGFVFYPWLPLLGGMIAASVAGSWLGTRLRRYLPGRDFHLAFRWLVTLLALRMVLVPFIAAG